MKWIRVASRIADDSKIRQLARDAGCDVFTAIGHLVTLWGVMTEQAKDGDISRVHDDDLEAWAEWAGKGRKAGRFATAVRARLCDAEGVISAWERYQGAAIREHEADRRRKAKPGTNPEPPGNSGGVPAEFRRSSEEIPPLRVRGREQDDTKNLLTSRDLSTGPGGDTRDARESAAPLALVRVEPAPAPVVVQHTAVVPARNRTPGRPGRTHEELKHAIAAEFDDLAAQTERRRSIDDLRRFQAEIAFTYWQTVFDKRRAIYDAKRERLLLARLVEAPLGEGLSTLLYAIDGARADPYVRDKRGGDLAAIVCDRSHVEEFAGKSKAHERGDVHPRALKFVAAIHVATTPGQEVAAHAS